MVKGSKDFQRLVWAAAAKRGLSVDGYVPSAYERSMLEQNQEASRPPRRDALDSRADGRQRERPTYSLAGTLVDYGSAPFRNQQGNSPSYFVSLRSDSGSVTLPLFVLLYDQATASGQAIACELRRFAADPDAPAVTELNVDRPHLARAAERVVELALTLLLREGYRRESLEVHFRLPKSLPTIEGESAGLLFALGVMVRSLALPDPPNALAATGILDEQGRVQPVIGVAEKISAALDVMPTGGVIFYPRGNSTAVPSSLFRRAKAQDVRLIVAAHVDHDLAVIRGFSHDPHQVA